MFAPPLPVCSWPAPHPAAKQDGHGVYVRLNGAHSGHPQCQAGHPQCGTWPPGWWPTYHVAPACVDPAAQWRGRSAGNAAHERGRACWAWLPHVCSSRIALQWWTVCGPQVKSFKQVAVPVTFGAPDLQSRWPQATRHSAIGLVAADPGSVLTGRVECDQPASEAVAYVRTDSRSSTCQVPIQRARMHAPTVQACLGS